MSLVGGGALLLGTTPAIFLMERCGRRIWAIVSFFFLFFSDPQRNEFPKSEF
jgi:hypothetical protein